ncbi:MAG: MATE family efflux transporter, partial [Gemmatimonadetes bacterium]|nr:MATE family efflux transporter [Gemmatimonadota bacterium]
AAAAQSLIGYYLGAESVARARRVARTACIWGFATGSALALGMIALTKPASLALLPESARAVFPLAWFFSALAQPMNALSFVTDGIHMGTGDYRFLRNGMVVATLVSALLLFGVDRSPGGTLATIWLVTAVWIAMRTVWGMARIWPGWGKAPLRPPN